MRLRDFRKQSYALVEDFTACVDRALEKCDNHTEAENLNFVKLVLTATSNLNWFDEDAEPEPTTTAATTTTSTEAPSTSKWRAGGLRRSRYLLVGVQSALCFDEADEKCDVTKATTCYWSEAKAHGVDILVPKQSVQDYPDDVCRTEADLPEDSVCSEYYSACGAAEKALFKHKENGYAFLRTLLLNKTICEGIELLKACIKRDVMDKCSAKFTDIYSDLNAEANEKAAKNLSQCLDLALKPCENIVHDYTRPGYMKELAAAINNLYEAPKHPQPTIPTSPTTTEASTPLTSSTTAPTTHEPVTTVTQQPATSTTQQPVTSTTQQPATSTTQQPVTPTTAVPPTTPAPP
ncbi:hypothetical protein MTO96_024755 [Rhipicephalus appendiculatus]